MTTLSCPLVFCRCGWVATTRARRKVRSHVVRASRQHATKRRPSAISLIVYQPQRVAPPAASTPCGTQTHPPRRALVPSARANPSPHHLLLARPCRRASPHESPTSIWPTVKYVFSCQTSISPDILRLSAPPVSSNLPTTQLSTPPPFRDTPATLSKAADAVEFLSRGRQVLRTNSAAPRHQRNLWAPARMPNNAL